MGDNEKGNKHKKIKYIVVLVALAVLPIAIWVVLPILNCAEKIAIDTSGWIAMAVGTITYVGTIILAAITVWQNAKQREDSEKVQNRLVQPFMSKEIVLCNKDFLKEGMEHTVVKISNAGNISYVETRTSLSKEYQKLDQLSKECADLCKDVKTDLYSEELDLHHLKFDPNQFILKNCGAGHAMNVNLLINNAPVCANKSIVSTGELRVNILFDFYENSKTNKFADMKLDFEILYSNMLGQAYIQRFYINYRSSKDGTPNLVDDCNSITVPQLTDKSLKEIIGELK